MEKIKGLTRKGNVITIQCEDRKEAGYVFNRIAHYIGMFRWLGGSQWTEKQVEEMKARIKKNARAKHAR